VAKVLRPGESIRGYHIKRLLNKGNMAIAFEALSPRKERVFLKQYKSPSPTLPWFKDYVAYQKEMKSRIEASRVKHFSCRIVDFFEEKCGTLCYFQVFEFVESGHDLETTLADLRASPARHPFANRLTLAKVFVSGLQALHDSKIVHADLKPPNIQLFEDKTIKTGYQLKLIDMDYSVLSDRKAPWDGHRGYIGSPRYFSPEHQAGVSPQTGSDMFTAALILYELLGDTHPYPLDDQEYTDAINRYRVAPPKLDGDSGNNHVIAEVLHRCLNPDVSLRPCATELSNALRGGGSITITKSSESDAEEDEIVVIDSEPKKSVVVESKKRTETRKDSPKQQSLTLRDVRGKQIVMRIRTSVGKYLVRTFGDESRFWDQEQFVLAPQPDGSWSVHPNTGSGNETILNGKAITTSIPLKSGDTLAVGREAKGVIKLPLTVQLDEISDGLEV
jgi:serine/threonine protein kinase